MLQGIILKDDKRYDYTEDYLKRLGYIFCQIEASPENLDFVIFPFMRDIDHNIYNEQFFAALKKDIFIFSGIKNEYLADKCAKHGLVYSVLMEDRAVTIKNAIPTSEGVISYLITNRLDTLANSCVLIIGYGTCGRDLSKKIRALGADVYALVRNREKEALAHADFVTPIYLDKLFHEKAFDIIINTVPGLVLTNEMLDKTENALLIDIASKPYGFDMEYAKKINKKSSLLSGIPGKYALRTAGEILGEYINDVMNRR